MSAALAQYGAYGWIGAVIGFVGTGYAIRLFGISTTFALGIILAFIAFVLVIIVRSTRTDLPAIAALIEAEAAIQAE